MDRRFLRKYAIIGVCCFFWGILLFSGVHPARCADFQSNLKLRWDTGKEVDNALDASFPDNMVDRDYLEELYTLEALFTKPVIGDRLRLGVRLLELQTSQMDKVKLGLANQRRLDDKVYAQLNWGKWDIWGGDVYETFGKGLALNLFENRDLYFDSGLRGGKFSYRSNTVRWKAIYGRSRSGYLVEEENIGGANLEFRPIKGLLIGGSLVHQEGITYDVQFMPEGYIGLDLGFLSIFGEYAQRRPEDGELLQGDGTYLSVEASTIGLAAHVGYKYYQFGEDNPFQTPPIVQREYTTHLLSEHPHIPLIEDQVGFEVDLSATPTEIAFLSVNFSQSSKHKGAELLPSLKQDFNPFWELFFEGELYPRPDLTLKLGAGKNEEARLLYWQKKTAAMTEVIYNIKDLWSVTTVAENMWVNDKEAGEDHHEQWLSLNLARAPYGSLNFSFEQSSLSSPEEGDRWMGFEIAADVKTNHRLMLFYGRERGGLKCTSGVCRPVQPFEGFRITYEGRF